MNLRFKKPKQEPNTKTFYKVNFDQTQISWNSSTIISSKITWKQTPRPEHVMNQFDMNGITLYPILYKLYDSADNIWG